MTVYELNTTRPNPGTLYSETNPIPYGAHLHYDQGYDAAVRQVGRQPPRAETHDASGHFYSSSLGASISLWISEVAADFSLSGQVGQSRMVREFFPRSFNDVTLTITGNVSSTQEYNRLATFVRESHWQSLRKINEGQTSDQTITFELYDNTPKQWRAAKRATDETIQLTGRPARGSQANVKGAHRPWKVSGYIKRMAAGAVHQEVAPQFQVEFIVTDSWLTPSSGIWSDVSANPVALSTFMDLLRIAKKADRATGTGFISNPTPAPKPPPNPVAQGVQGATGWSQTGWLSTLLW